MEELIAKENIRKLNALYVKLILDLKKSVKKVIKQERKLIPHDQTRIEIEKETHKEVFKILQGKWTLEIIYLVHLLNKPRYNELKKYLKDISSRILSDRLKFLKEKGIIEREIEESFPVKVFYKLTYFGRGVYFLMIPLLSYIALSLSELVNPILEKEL